MTKDMVGENLITMEIFFQRTNYDFWKNSDIDFLFDNSYFQDIDLR